MNKVHYFNIIISIFLCNIVDDPGRVSPVPSEISGPTPTPDHPNIVI